MRLWAKVLKDRRSPRRRGRMGTSVNQNAPQSALALRPERPPVPRSRLRLRRGSMPPERPLDRRPPGQVHDREDVAEPPVERDEHLRGGVQARALDLARPRRAAARQRGNPSHRLARRVADDAAARARRAAGDARHVVAQLDRPQVRAQGSIRSARVRQRLRVVPYERVSGWSSKASGGVERRRGRGLKARGWAERCAGKSP